MFSDIYGTANAFERDAEINIAPLVDMVFILLIFFLVTTSFVKESGLSVNKPVAATAEELEQNNIVITITADNTIYLADTAVLTDDIKPMLRHRLKANPNKPVVILADRDSRHATLIDVIDECKLAGAHAINLAAEIE